MKNVYIRYGTSTHLIEEQLTPKEKKMLKEYRTKLLTTASPLKVQQGINFVLQFRDILEKPLFKIEKSDLIKFWSLVNQSENHEFNTKIMVRRSVKRFCKFHYENYGKLFEDLTIGNFKPNRKKINKTTLLSSKEIGRMLRRAETLKEKALLILMYESAGRPQEIRDLKWSDINFDIQEVHLDSNKTERDRDIPIKESIIHLKRWRQEFAFEDVIDNDFVFPSRWRDKKLTTEGINKIVQTICNRAGINKHITSYTLRHSRLSEIYKLDIKGLDHNKFAGHKEGSKQTATYVHMDNGDMKEEVLKKVYNVKEISEVDKSDMESRIKLLERVLLEKINRTNSKTIKEAAVLYKEE